jgi:exonuclease SbcC
MIQGLKIFNYQSLRELEIALGRFTVIFGESDTGKSAIIRAIHSAVNNQAGQDFISHGKSNATVIFELESLTVDWTKGKSATYSLKKSDALKETFEKMGRNVPEEISEVLKIGRTAFGEQEFDANIHSQMEPPFLLTESPATRAKLLGEMSGVNILYRAIQECRRRVQSTKRLQTTRLNDLEKSKEDLHSYRYLTDISKALAFIDKQMEELIEISSKAQAIAMSILDLEEDQGHIARLSKHASNPLLIEKIDEALKIESRVDSMSTEIEKLSQMKMKIDQDKKRLLAMKQRIESLQADVDEIKICPTCGQEIEKAVELHEVHPN